MNFPDLFLSTKSTLTLNCGGLYNRRSFSCCLKRIGKEFGRCRSFWTLYSSLLCRSPWNLNLFSTFFDFFSGRWWCWWWRRRFNWRRGFHWNWDWTIGVKRLEANYWLRGKIWLSLLRSFRCCTFYTVNYDYIIFLTCRSFSLAEKLSLRSDWKIEALRIKWK